jgi:hypothetical protein
MEMLHVKIPAAYTAERQYIIGVILGEFLGLDYRIEVMDRADVSLSRPDGREVILDDSFFQTLGSRWLTAASLPKQPLESWVLPGTVVQPQLPVIYGRRYQEIHPDRLTLGLDIFGSSFFMLSRYEEAVKPNRDEHGRFPAAASLALQEGFLDRPVVDEYVEVLWRALTTLWPGLVRKRRPGRALISHDVDDAPSATDHSYARVLKHAAGDVVRRGSPLLAARRMASAVQARRGNPDADIRNTFEMAMTTAEQCGLRSTFCFGTAAAYRIGDPWILATMRRLWERGHAIGLLASSGDPEQVRYEAELLRLAAAKAGLRQDEWGGRAQRLRWEGPATWSAWAEAGLAYDSTLAYADHPGFRSGTCREHPVFDVRRRLPLRLRERPLIVADSVLLETMSMRPENAGEVILRLRERCRLVDGDFTLAWRNSALIHRPERELFRQIVRAL